MPRAKKRKLFNLGRMNKRILFLIRAYNDLDHIVPVAWKMASKGFDVAFSLTAEEFPDDYRINLLRTTGATRLKSWPIETYDRVFRPRIRPNTLRSLLDWIVAASFGYFFLKKNRIGCVVAEWGGASGRARASFFLRAARIMSLPTISIPHGYHTWLDNDFNETTKETILKTGQLPQFFDRNRYTRYVVQSENIKRYCVESGIEEAKIDVLGSARFCSEWSGLNLSMCVANTKQVAYGDNRNLVALFFLNHWEYNVDRDRCLGLLSLIAEQKSVTLIIKGHTRGKESGGLSPSEEKNLDRFDNVFYPGEDLHSPYLVAQSDVVIVYGSSICFEALRQSRTVIWPRFVCRNRTIFDTENVVTVAEDEGEVIEVMRDALEGNVSRVPQQRLDSFFCTHVEGGVSEVSVLDRYSNRIKSCLD